MFFLRLKYSFWIYLVSLRLGVPRVSPDHQSGLLHPPSRTFYMLAALSLYRLYCNARLVSDMGGDENTGGLFLRGLFDDGICHGWSLRPRYSLLDLAV